MTTTFVKHSGYEEGIEDGRFVQRGEIVEVSLPEPYYRDEYCTIFHGDCREILPLLEPVDLVLTDPPYGLGDKWTGGKKWGLHQGQMGWDSATIDFLPSVISAGRDAVIWGGHLYQLPPSRGWFVWDKVVRNFTSGHCELAWTTLDQPIKTFSYTHGELATEGKFHPTQKPLPLIKWCLSFFPFATTILDPFMGSGTTLVAARTLGIKAIGIELEEKYCAIAVDRLRQQAFSFEAPASYDTTGKGKSDYQERLPLEEIKTL